MDEAPVLARLDRIEALGRTSVAPGELLEELRGLLGEAEQQARGRAAAASDREGVVERSAGRVIGT
jgi:hypothetical protein